MLSKKNFFNLFLISLIPLTFINKSAKSETIANEVERQEYNYLNDKVDSNETILGSEYLLGPGDILLIEVFGLPELSGNFAVSPDGILYLKQIKQVKSNRLTIPELRNKLIARYSEFLIEPEINIALIKSRPVRVYVKGEVKNPGFYNLSQGADNFTISAELISQIPNPMEESSLLYPTLFDAIKRSGGITPYSQLNEVIVIRNNSYINGGGRIKTNLNFLSLFKTGDQSQNIRMMDGDTIIVKKSELSLKDQLLEVNRSNMNPKTVSVVISGEVKSPGAITLPKGSGLNQAIAATGGKNLLSGRIEFVRFLRDGEFERKVFSYNPKSNLDSKTNPILVDGDIINVYDSLLGKSTAFLNKIVTPVAPTFYLLELLDLR